MKRLPIISIDTLPVIYNQEVQLVDILKVHKEAIEWVVDMRDNNFKIFISDLFVFSTTFKDCLQNLSIVLKGNFGDRVNINLEKVELLVESLIILVKPLPKKKEATTQNPEVLSQHIEYIKYIDLDPLEPGPVFKLYLDLIIKKELLGFKEIGHIMVFCRKYSEVNPKSYRKLYIHIKIRARVEQVLRVV